jgi:type VI secretion system secreted protein Hcp
MRTRLLRFSALPGFAVLGVLLISGAVARAQSSQPRAVGAAADDFLLIVEGLAGESDLEPGAIDLASFSFGVQNAVGPGGGGGGAGRATFSDITVVKKLDKSSPVLLRACASGQHFPTVIITARKAGGKQQEYLKYTLKDIIVTSYQPGGTSNGGRPMESLSFTFATITTEYREQLRDGSLGPPIQTCWDVRTNRPC